MEVLTSEQREKIRKSDFSLEIPKSELWNCCWDDENCDSQVVNTQPNETEFESNHFVKYITDDSVTVSSSEFRLKIPKEELYPCCGTKNVYRLEEGNDSLAEITVLSGVDIHTANSYSPMAKGLGSLNTNRGSVNGFKGYIFEELHAGDTRFCGNQVTVLNDNGAVDLAVNGTPTQLKAGYHSSTPKWNDSYERVVVDKGNKQLVQKAERAGYIAEESTISCSEAENVANIMRKESAITGNVNAPITATVVSCHQAGLAAAGIAQKVYVPMKVGANIYDVINGDKSLEDAAVDTIVDGAVAVGSAYASGAALTAASTVIGGVGSVVAESAIGTAVCSATTTLAGTAVGGAIVGTVGTASAVVTGAVGAVAAAPVLPVVAVAAGIGFIGRAIFDWF